MNWRLRGGKAQTWVQGIISSAGKEYTLGGGGGSRNVGRYDQIN